MSLAVAVLKEQAEGEHRVALDPTSANKLANKGFQVLIENGAGDAAGFSDKQYSDCILLDDPETIVTMADIWLWVQAPAADLLATLPDGRFCMGLVFARRNPAVIDILGQHDLTCVAMELAPPNSSAPSMDVLSSQATIAGYHAALRAAALSPRLFPMLTTAAGTITAASVVIFGAGVAGLQAIATARRLGARVEAFDTHPEAREQIESLGAKMIDVSVSTEDEQGNALELSEEEIQHQQADKLAERVAQADVVISTVVIPDGPAPKIITETMVESMNPGSVIIDLAADSGGNCVLTEPGATVVRNGVRIDGPMSLASGAAMHASKMYAHGLLEMLGLLIEDESLKIDRDNEVVNRTLLTYEGQLVDKAVGEQPSDSVTIDSRGN